MTINNNQAKFFLKAGDVLQYALPTVAGLADLKDSIAAGEYRKTCLKAAYIIGLILLQNRSTVAMKKFFQKPRPGFPDDLESFPSGHAFIAAAVVTRVFLGSSDFSSRALAATGYVLTCLGRYIPLKHDLIDIGAGSLLGVGLGALWDWGVSRLE